MSYYLSFAAFIALVFAIIMYIFRKILPFKTLIIFLIAGTSFLLTAIFPYISALYDWIQIYFIYAILIFGFAVGICFVDSSYADVTEDIIDEQGQLIVPDEIVPDEVVLDEVVPEEIVPEEVVPDEVAPDEIVLDEIVPDEVIPEEIVTEEVAPDEVVPDEIVPDEIVSTDSSSEQDTYKPVNSMTIDDYILDGFKLRQSGNLPEAVDYFTRAMNLCNETKLSIEIGIEISTIYHEMEQHWQAAEILRIILATWENNMNEDLIKVIKDKIEVIEKYKNIRQSAI